jgi:hypothetical protein
MEIRQLYKTILETLNMDIDKDGMISMRVMDELFPAMVDGKRLVFPTETLLRAGVSDNVIAFHPLSENIIRGESPVIKKLRALIIYRLSEVIYTIMDQLIHIAADKDAHPKLTPTQSEFLSLVPRADAKTVKSFEKVLGMAETDGEHRLVSIYLKRGGHWKGNKYSRVAVTSFPITDDFDTNEPEIFGVKMRKSDKEALKNLFLYIVPNGESLEEYSHGSNSMTAPYFHALMKSYLKVAKQLNKVVKRFKKHLHNADELMIDTSWESEIEDLSIYRDIIPSLKGNEGNAVEAEEKVPTVNPTNHLKEMAAKVSGMSEPAAPPVEKPQPPTPPVPPQGGQVQKPAQNPSSGNGLSWSEVVSRNPSCQHQIAAQGQQPAAWNPTPPPPPTTRGGYMAPQPTYPMVQPQYGQPVYNPYPNYNPI